MKKIIFVIWILSNFGVISPVRADGKLLRGEKWQKFSVPTTADFYVAPNGSDAWSGTLAEPNADRSDGPFATLERAQQAVRELKAHVYLPKDDPIEKRFIGSPHPLGKGRDILVLLRGGRYFLAEPLLFEPQDGGERIETNLPTGAFEYHKLRDHYVTWAAWPGETAVIVGGDPVQGWQEKEGVWSAPVKGGVEALVVNGRKQTLARAPNHGYFTPPRLSTSARELHFRQGELQSWDNMDNNRVTLLLRWHKGVNSFKRIDEYKNIAYLREEQPGILIVPPRYFVENVSTLLDAPGEWFYNAASRQLKWIPGQGISSPEEIAAVVPRLYNLVHVRGSREKPVRNLRFYGLEFESTLPGGQALVFEYAHACELVDCDVHALAGMGVYLGKGNYQARILDNRFTQVEQGVVHVDGEAHPENWMDIIRQTRISGNRIDDCGGVNIEAHNTLYTTISRNEISNNSGRFAISVGGWRNLEEAIDGGYRVEYNHLHDVQKEADDSGVIKTAGMTYDSIVRRNLIHDVKAGYFNDNVGFWFDNMSHGWVSEENIFYNLEQGEMKLCAANLVDNIYRNNFIVAEPDRPPENIIDGEPLFEYSDLNLRPKRTNAAGEVELGTVIQITAMVRNVGATGILPVRLFLDGKVAETKLFPVIRGNKRQIAFKTRLFTPGMHRFSIANTEMQTLTLVGDPPPVVFQNLLLSDSLAPAGDRITVAVTAVNRSSEKQNIVAQLFIDDDVVKSKNLFLTENDSVAVSFNMQPPVGPHRIRVNSSEAANMRIFPVEGIDLDLGKAKVYGSGRARPFDVRIDGQKVIIAASGSDFFHAEDSYAALYFPKIGGNFVATVKVNRFGERTHEWFRAGLFVRNDMAKSYDTKPGSKGSVLLFTTPGRYGLDWDEFGDGCMHKALSTNLPEDVQFPLWLKLVRRGDSFTGYVSYDGVAWTLEKRTGPIPGLNAAVDIGLAAGSCDELQYQVEFEDFELAVEADE